MLGDGSGKVFASGGEDGTVRLWSLSSSGKRGQQALKATLYGHAKPVKLMTVAGYDFVCFVRIWSINSYESLHLTKFYCNYIFSGFLVNEVVTKVSAYGLLGFSCLHLYSLIWKNLHDWREYDVS